MPKTKYAQRIHDKQHRFDPLLRLIKGECALADSDKERMAKSAGMSLSTLNRRLKAPETIQIGELELIAKYIGTTPDELLRGIKWA